MPFAGSGVGLLIESHEGRPTKVEGNPDHPSSLGATDLFAQAAILGLYDPDRSQVLTHLGEIRPFEAFATAIRQVLDAQQGSQGSGIRVLSETVSSPTLAAQIDEFMRRFPQAKWLQWEPFGRHNVREGSRLAFGEYVDAQYAIERADVILSLDSDFLVTGMARWRMPVPMRPAARARVTARSAIACTQSRARRPIRERRPTIDFCFVPPTLALLPAQWLRNSGSRRQPAAPHPSRASRGSVPS